MLIFSSVEKFDKEVNEKVLEKPCTYVIRKGDEILYVGSTINCRNRLKKHFIYMNSNGSILIKHIKKLGLNPMQVLLGSTIWIEYCNNIKECREREEKFIKILKPKFNIRKKK